MSEKSIAHPYICNTCVIVCSGPESYQQHLLGSKHIRREHQRKTYGPIHEPAPPQNLDYPCQVCQTVMSGLESYLAHMSGNPHAKKVKKQELIRSMAAENTSNVVGIEITLNEKTENMQAPVVLKAEAVLNTRQLQSLDSYHFCALCQVHLSGPESAKMHYEGAQHLRRKKRQSTDTLSFTSPSLDSMNQQLSNLKV